jgi:hypothetical protein
MSSLSADYPAPFSKISAKHLHPSHGLTASGLRSIAPTRGHAHSLERRFLSVDYLLTHPNSPNLLRYRRIGASPTCGGSISKNRVVPNGPRVSAAGAEADGSAMNTWAEPVLRGARGCPRPGGPAPAQETARRHSFLAGSVVQRKEQVNAGFGVLVLIKKYTATRTATHAECSQRRSF